jgi:hypothetical protein
MPTFSLLLKRKTKQNNGDNQITAKGTRTLKDMVKQIKRAMETTAATSSSNSFFQCIFSILVVDLPLFRVIKDLIRLR